MHYLFGDCILDLHRRELRRADVIIPLEPKAYQMLVYLMEQRDRVVTRAELLEYVWPGVYVDNSAVARCIRAIRRAVGDSPEAQRVIRTRRGHGYRFVATVTAPPLSALASETEEGATPAMVRPCAACQQPNPDAARFCGACGAPLPDTCGRDGQAGALPPVPHGVGGERKLITVLYGVITPVLALEARLGLDGLHEWVQEAERLVRRVVQPYGGTLRELVGDRMMVLFGMPETQEDHALRAILAALALQQQGSAFLATFDHLSADGLAETALTMQIGLHTGLVVVGESTDRPEHAVTVVGDVPALAAALAQQAMSGTIVVSAAMASLVQGAVRLEAIPPLPAAGQSTPVAAFRVQGRAAGNVWQARYAERLRSRFVGREEELTTLHRCLTQARQGRGQVIGIIGASGIGKSRLLAEFRHAVAAQPVTILAGGCTSYGHSMPYAPLRELVRKLCGCTETDDQATLASKIGERLRTLGMTPDVWTPVLLHLLGVAEAAEGLARLPPQERQTRAFEALHQLLMQSSQPQPLIVAVEDVHWIDPTSEAYLAALVERLAGASMLLMVTARPGYRPPLAGHVLCDPDCPATPDASGQPAGCALISAPCTSSGVHYSADCGKSAGESLFSGGVSAAGGRAG